MTGAFATMDNEGRIYQRGLGPAPWPKHEAFSAQRARQMGQHARSALQGDYEAFNELALVPIEEKTTERSEFRGAAKHTV